jgi:plastocyanin
MTTPETPVDTRPDESPSPTHAPPTDPRWLTLQRGVAVGMILTFVAVRLLAPQLLGVPLVPAGLFAVALALTWWRPRGAAIGIGILATLWLLTQIVTIRALLPDLARPDDTDLFVTTVAMLVVPIAGVAGLVGLLGRRSGRIATTVLQATGVIVLAGALVGVVAGVVGDDSPPPVSDSPTVTLVDTSYEPRDVTIRAEDTVTWVWQDGAVQHDVVAESFRSEVQANGTYRHTFEEPGIYAYRCTLHPRMTGTVTVVATDSTTN